MPSSPVFLIFHTEDPPLQSGTSPRKAAANEFTSANGQDAVLELQFDFGRGIGENFSASLNGDPTVSVQNRGLPRREQIGYVEALSGLKLLYTKFHTASLPHKLFSCFKQA